MTQLETTVFEFRQRPIVGTRGKAVGGVLQRRLGGDDLEHPVRVVLPVGGAVEVAAGGELLRDQGDEVGLDDAALEVPLLAPRVGEEQMHAGERAVGDHVAHHLDGVVLHDAQVGEIALGDQLAQRAHARGVHLDAEEVVVRHRRGDLRRGLAHAEADLEDLRRLAAESHVQIERRDTVVDADLGQHVVQVALLRLGHAALAQHEAADAAAGEAVLGAVAADDFDAGHGFVSYFAHEPISPCVGELGSAE